MFQRLQVEEWQNIMAMVGLMLFFIVFLLILLRVFRMPKENLRHMENLPLEEETR